MKQFNLIYLFNFSKKAAEFTIFVENRSTKLSIAFKELCNGYLTYPFVLFSAEDTFLSPASGFLTIKSFVRIYFYLSFFFAYTQFNENP